MAASAAARDIDEDLITAAHDDRREARIPKTTKVRCHLEALGHNVEESNVCTPIRLFFAGEDDPVGKWVNINYRGGRLEPNIPKPPL